MNYEEIIPDFETLKQEILDFKRGMTVDDFYFYEFQCAAFQGRESTKFEKRLDELCKNYFETNWNQLDNKLRQWYKVASEVRNTKEQNRLNGLNYYFFGRKLSKNEFGVYSVKQEENIENQCLESLLEVSKPASSNHFPSNWKFIVNKFIEQKWNLFSGLFYNDSGFQYIPSHDSPKKLSIIDYTCFLALKNALRSDLYITTHENEILLIISSGIAAKIAIRKTGKYAAESTQSGKQIYSMTKFSYDKEKNYDYEDKTLLHVSGYTNSRVNLQIPNGYYFVDENYVVEVEFIAAPILLNNGVMPLMATADHASRSLLDDEEEERKRLEEDDL